MSAYTGSWLLTLPPQVLRAISSDMVNEAWNDLDDAALDELLWTKWGSNVLNICHMINHERRALCLVCHELNGLVDLDAGTGPPFCSPACHSILCSRLSNLLAKCPPPPVAASSSSGGSSSSLALIDEFDEGDERTVAGPPGKRPKPAPDALLARFLRSGETFSLIGNHPNANDDDFASSQSLRKQLPPIFWEAFGFTDETYELMMTRTDSYDVNASADNTLPWTRYDAALFLLKLYEAPGKTRALGMGVCIDHLEQLQGHYELAVRAAGSKVAAASAKYFGDNANKEMKVRNDKPLADGSAGTETVWSVHMRPETYGGDNLSIFRFVQGGFVSPGKELKDVPLAIAGHANNVEGGLAKYLRSNLVKLVRNLASDDVIAAIPKDRIHHIDVTKLRRYVKSNKPPAEPVHFKEKKKSEPARQKK